ncbi:signal peptide peptidase-like isoform X5 [Diospyros lotus]|uniref:signal peptide peptidase-like isoform X5 n=1 Tax=Diospyros lotus TaxID=55363 RepID=UPI0022581E0F|nr:signal peptide peptidase-like isoform X5 [Diospyros lotus]
MRNSERFANIALAGLTLAPLFIKVDPNLNVILTACLMVYVGCYRSVKPTPPSETMSNEHAMRFPLVGSAMLLSLFLLFKFLSKDLVNAVLTCYFFVLGIVALSTRRYVTICPVGRAINRGKVR